MPCTQCLQSARGLWYIVLPLVPVLRLCPSTLQVSKLSSSTLCTHDLVQDSGSSCCLAPCSTATSSTHRPQAEHATMPARCEQLAWFQIGVCVITVGTVCSSEKSVPCVYRVHTDNASQTSVGLASSDTSCFNIVQCKYFTNTCNWV